MQSSSRALADVDDAYDVICVGGGLGGLAAAASAGARGLTVLIVEAAELVGGGGASGADRGDVQRRGAARRGSAVRPWRQGVRAPALRRSHTACIFGLATDGQARVLRRAGEEIPGLYATGVRCSTSPLVWRPLPPWSEPERLHR